ncbi:S16 family serine protease [Williamsoniiplasma lucivorax]|uniref:endopeptidase La n=1 Tax=Williamsoniiplasma lucivorax TaxID=209274 RepID=A0A2S5R9V8_9MOLU|nr:S16 family serine protease [Williamsoniiplasma lucivorax]PPE04083.1 ATP-dependent Lon protease [Williamsoniiplasma lucivorax]
MKKFWCIFTICIVVVSAVLGVFFYVWTNNQHVDEQISLNTRRKTAIGIEVDELTKGGCSNLNVVEQPFENGDPKILDNLKIDLEQSKITFTPIATGETKVQLRATKGAQEAVLQTWELSNVVKKGYVPIVEVREIFPQKIGAIHGLAVVDGKKIRPTRGETFTIIVTPTKGSGRVSISDNAMETMCQSLQTAWTYIATNSELFRISKETMQTTNMHIQFWPTFSRYDGPSAGTAFTTAMISSLLKRPIAQDVSMTGEITADGSVGAIGGLAYKIRAAIKSGIKKIWIPKANEKQLAEIDEGLWKNKIEIKKATQYSEIFEDVFQEKVAEITPAPTVNTNIFRNLLLNYLKQI